MVFSVGMKIRRKITVEVRPELQRQAQPAQTGLQLMVASEAYARLRQMRGQVRFSRTSKQLKYDR